MRHFREALKIAPNYQEAYKNLGILLDFNPGDR
jgi:hypothetical protein